MKDFIIKDDSIRNNCLEYIKNMDITDKLLEVVIRPFEAQRSKAQNRLMRMWIDDIRSMNGDTHQDMHDFLRSTYLPIIKRRVNGIELVELTSTADLKVKDFIQYLEEIEAFAIEHGIILRYPDLYNFAMGNKKP